MKLQRNPSQILANKVAWVEMKDAVVLWLMVSWIRMRQAEGQGIPSMPFGDTSTAVVATVPSTRSLSLTPRPGIAPPPLTAAIPRSLQETVSTPSPSVGIPVMPFSSPVAGPAPVSTPVPVPAPAPVDASPVAMPTEASSPAVSPVASPVTASSPITSPVAVPMAMPTDANHSPTKEQPNDPPTGVITTYGKNDKKTDDKNTDTTSSNDNGNIVSDVAQATGTSTGLIIGIAVGVAALLVAAIVICLVCCCRRRGSNKTLGTLDSPTESKTGHEMIVDSSEQDDISTLGIPFGFPRYEGGESVEDPSMTDATTANNRRLLAAMASGASKATMELEEIYDEESVLPRNAFHVTAPPGRLGIVLEDSPQGIAQVHSIKPTSVLAPHVQEGDTLVRIDGVDVSQRDCRYAIKILAGNNDHERLLVFSRNETSF